MTSHPPSHPLLRWDDGTKDCLSQFIGVHGCDNDGDLEKQIRKKRNIIHTATMQNHLESIPNNPLIGRTAPDVNAAETLLPRVTKRTLAQLRAGKSPLLKEYIHRIGKADDPGCPLCENGVHNTAHLFECT